MSDDSKPPTVEDPQVSDWQRVHLWQIQSVRDLLLLAALLGMVYLGYVLSVVTVPLLVALGVAYLVEPLVAWLTARAPWLGRKGAVLSIMGLLACTLAITLIVTVPMVVRQATQLMKNSDSYIERARAFVVAKHWPEWMQDGLGTLVDLVPGSQKPPAPETPAASIPGQERQQQEQVIAEPAPPTPPSDSVPLDKPSPTALDEAAVRALVREELTRQSSPSVADAGSAARGAISTVASGTAQVLAFLVGIVGSVAQLAIFVFIMVFCFFFFSTAFPRVKQWGASFIPAHGRERTLELTGKMDRAISGFVRGRLTICAVMGVIYATGWTFCGVPHAVLLGLVVGACGLVPYLSAIGLPIAWALLVVSLTGASDKSGFYFSGDGSAAAIVWWKVLLFPAIVNVLAQTVEDYVLNPMIQGKATNLHPATILLACIAGGSLAGLYGLILAIPVTACLKILTEDVLLPRLQQWLAGRKEDPLPM